MQVKYICDIKAANEPANSFQTIYYVQELLDNAEQDAIDIS